MPPFVTAAAVVRAAYERLLLVTPPRAQRRLRSPRSTSRQDNFVSRHGAGAPPRERTGPSPSGFHSTHVAEPAAAAAMPQPFASMPLHPALLDVLAQQGLTATTPIQSATLSDAIAGRDVLGRARTGSGKTLAFGLALLTRLAGRRSQPRRPIALVLVPTRELAAQVADVLTPYATAVGLSTTVVVGGVALSRQAEALRRGVELVIATPGRLNDLVARGDCQLGRIEISVLDEADQMADMGFLPQVTALLTGTDPTGQRLLFSATLDSDVDRLVRRFLTDPVSRSVDPPASAVTTLNHHILHVEAADKSDTALHIAARRGRVIMFVGTKRRADRVARDLAASGIAVAALHGGKSQPQRTRALDGFRRGTVNALVATSIAARGIDVEDVDLVVNVDPPLTAKDYLHRGGRTARAGRAGSVVTLVLPEQRGDIVRLLADAGVTARADQVRPGDATLRRITGARTPSGATRTEVAAATSASRRGRPTQSPTRNRSRSGTRGRTTHADTPTARLARPLDLAG